MRRLPRAFFARRSPLVARQLLGCTLLVDGVGGPIIETEAYDQSDEACHAYKGKTPRCATLFERAGTLYVYRIHQSYCMNTVTRRAGIGAGVLLRAILPAHKAELIAARRRGQPPKRWCDGPGKLTRALAIDLGDDGADLLARDGRIAILESGRVVYRDNEVALTPRIGISKARERLWRFVVKEPRPR